MHHANGVAAVQQFIQDNGVDALTDQFDITVKKYDNGYVKLNYNQISSPKFHVLVDACRGLTIQVFPDNSSKVVARGFTRFYNLGEGTTQNFDFSDCTIWEKMDGSLVTLYFSPVDSKWVVGTRGMTYAEGNFTFSLTASGGTFADWIMKAMRLTEDQLQVCMSSFSRDHTYVQEFCGDVNRIVTPYVGSFMVLLAVIRTETGEEVVDLAPVCDKLAQCGMNVRMPATYEATSGDELIALANSLPGLREGFVVVNNKTRERVKIKSTAYVMLHQLKGNGTPSLARLMELVLTNETAETLLYFPEFTQYIDPIENALARLLATANELYTATSSIESQKEFALAVKDSPLAPLLFRVKKDGHPPTKTFSTLDIGLQMKLLEKFLLPA